MSRELIEAAKAVVDVHYASGGLRTEYLSGKGWRSWVTLLAALRSAVERAEAERNVIENVDEARVREAVKAVCAEVFQSHYHPHNKTTEGIAAALRPYVLPSPAPQPGTVAVPVETLRELRDIATKLLSDRDAHNVCAAVRATVDALLPPPSPSEADRERWEAEFRDWAYDYPLSDLVNEPYYDKLRDAWMSSAEAEWRGKNGGAK